MLKQQYYDSTKTKMSNSSNIESHGITVISQSLRNRKAPFIALTSVY